MTLTYHLVLSINLPTIGALSPEYLLNSRKSRYDCHQDVTNKRSTSMILSSKQLTRQSRATTVDKANKAKTVIKQKQCVTEQKQCVACKHEPYYKLMTRQEWKSEFFRLHLADAYF